MNDINVILDGIRKEAEATISKITQSRDEELEKIKAELYADFQKNEKEIAEKHKILLERTENSGKAQCIGLLKRSKENAKIDAINKIIDSYRKKIEELPDDTYFDLIIKLVGKYAEDKPGEVILSVHEKKRNAEILVQKLGELKRNNKLCFLGKYTDEIESGIMVVYGGIQENLSWESVFESNSDEIKDALMHEIFEEK